MELNQDDFNAWVQMHPDDAIAGDRGQPAGCIVANWLNDQPGVSNASVGGTRITLNLDGFPLWETIPVPRWVRRAVIRFDSIPVAEPFGPVTFGQFRGVAGPSFIDVLIEQRLENESVKALESYGEPKIEDWERDADAQSVTV